MNLLKYGMVIIICGIILVLVYHHLIKVTPEDKVQSVLMNIDSTKVRFVLKDTGFNDW